MTRLEQSLADYLQLRRSLGHQLADAGRLLPRFVGFLDDRGLSTVTVAAAVEWATTPATDPRSTVGPRRMTAVRGFARYLAGVDPATEVPPLGLLPQPARWRGPFVFSPADIELIMNRVGELHAAAAVGDLRHPDRPARRHRAPDRGGDQTRPGRHRLVDRGAADP